VSDPCVVGLDLSLTSTGVALADGRVCRLRIDGFGPKRIEWIRATIMDLVPAEIELAVIEWYSFGARGSHVREIAELGGVVRNALWRARVPYLDVPPSTLKKAATGNGKAKKYEVMRAAERRLGYEGTEDDESDALWLRAIGWELLGCSPCDWTKAGLDAIEPLRHVTPHLCPPTQEAAP
jgi:Holliday junction resolvasome RuvABC endonuclease subunit